MRGEGKTTLESWLRLCLYGEGTADCNGESLHHMQRNRHLHDWKLIKFFQSFPLLLSCCVASRSGCIICILLWPLVLYLLSVASPVYALWFDFHSFSHNCLDVADAELHNLFSAQFIFVDSWHFTCSYFYQANKCLREGSLVVLDYQLTLQLYWILTSPQLYFFSLDLPNPLALVESVSSAAVSCFQQKSHWWQWYKVSD